MRDAGLNVGQRVLVRFRLLGFSVVFLLCVIGFRIRLFGLLLRALGSELLGLGFHAGSDSVAVWVRLGMTWVMPPRTIIYYLPKTLNSTSKEWLAGWVIVLAGRSETLFCLMEKDSISGFSLYALLSGFYVFMLSVSG